MSDHTITATSETAHASHAHAPHDHDAHAPLQYLLTLFALLTLTAITVGVSYIDFGSGNIIVAVFVATIKAILVGLIFMHLLHDKKINAVIFVASFMFLSLLFLFTFLDEGSRFLPPVSKPPAGGIPQPAMQRATAIDGKEVGTEEPKPTPATSSAPGGSAVPAAAPAK
jgi:cytochrome c oxidase subunit 4